MLVPALTKRELEVLDLIIAGRLNREIAALLNISIKTVENHVTAIFLKLGVRTRTEAAVKSLFSRMNKQK